MYRNLPTPTQVAKMYNISLDDLISDIDNLSHTSLLNLRRTNPKKYEVTVLGLVSNNYKISLDDLVVLKEKKEILNKIY